MPITVFVLVISTQSHVKHHNVINPVRLTKYHIITVVIFVTHNIDTIATYRTISTIFQPYSPTAILSTMFCISSVVIKFVVIDKDDIQVYTVWPASFQG